MAQLTDYSSMFGILDDWTKEKFQKNKEIYDKEIYNVGCQIKDLQYKYHQLIKNSDWFAKRIKEIQITETEKQFVLKPEHKLILQQIEIHFDSDGGRPRAKNLQYLYENYLQLVFKLDKYKLSEEQIDDYQQRFDKLMDEIPFAIKALSK